MPATTLIDGVEWLNQLGLNDQVGLNWLAATVKDAARREPGSVSVTTIWPSSPPSSLLAWGANHLGTGRAEEHPIRALFTGRGQPDIRLLAEVVVDRERVRSLWLPDASIGMNAMRDAMACAFVQGRLKPEAPRHVSMSSLLPVLRPSADPKQPWPEKWKGFMQNAREFLPSSRGGRFGFLWHQYGNANSTRPFAFVLPQISTGPRRSREFSSIPGGIDLIVADLSAYWMSPTRVADEVAALLVDIGIGAATPPVLVFVSDPRACLASRARIRELREKQIASARAVHHASIHYIGDRKGRTSDQEEWAAQIEIHSASTTEADVQQALGELADKVEVTHPKTANAILDAAIELARMSWSIAPPLAETELPETAWSFIDAAGVVRHTMREEGPPSEEASIEAALNRGRDAATNLMRRSPAHLAFLDAVAEAQSGKSVVFVAENEHEIPGTATRIPACMTVISRRSAGTEIAKQSVDLVVTACRAKDAIRILAELSSAPKRAVLLLPPPDAAIATRIAELLLERPEFSAASPFLSALVSAMPPNFARAYKADMGARIEQRSRGHRNAPTVSSTRDLRNGVILHTSDGDEIEFAKASLVVMLVRGVPVARKASQLEPGDLVVVLPGELGDRIARELGWDGEAALMDEQVARYKEHVRSWRTGAGRNVSPRQVIERMQAIDVNMSTPSVQTIRYWLDAGDAQSEAAPHASNDARWLSAFLQVIGVGEADDFFVHFGRYRGRLQREGHVRSGLLERFLFDKYDAIVQRGVTAQRAEELRAIALQHTREVVIVERQDVGGDEQ